MAKNYPIKKTGDTSKKNCRIVATIKAQKKSHLFLAIWQFLLAKSLNLARKKGAEVSQGSVCGDGWGFLSVAKVAIIDRKIKPNMAISQTWSFYKKNSSFFFFFFSLRFLNQI